MLDFPEPLFPMSNTFCFLTFLSCAWAAAEALIGSPPATVAGEAPIFVSYSDMMPRQLIGARVVLLSKFSGRYKYRGQVTDSDDVGVVEVTDLGLAGNTVGTVGQQQPCARPARKVSREGEVGSRFRWGWLVERRQQTWPAHVITKKAPPPTFRVLLWVKRN